MNSHFHHIILLAGLLLSHCVIAQDDEVKAAVAISIQQDQEIWTGQQVTLNLDLKTTGFSFSNSHFNLPEVNGAFLMQTDTTTIKFSEKIDGQDWQIVRYPLALYPQIPGRLEIPPIDVRFTSSAGFGSTTKDFEFQTAPLELLVNSPPGSKEGALLITTTSFELDHSWQPQSGAAHSGDAVSLTVSRRASDISAMLLPPLPVFRADGLAAYPQAPEINDKTDRGDLTGERIDTITWVVEKPGVYEIPGIRFQWWDPLKRELKQQIIPGLSLDILLSTVDTSVTGETGKPAQDMRRPLLVPGVILAMLLVAILWIRFSRKPGAQKPGNEKAAFAHLQKACKSNRANQAHTAMYTWLSCAVLPANIRPVMLGEFARLFNDKKFTSELEGLQKALINPNNQWQGDALLKSLQRIRGILSQQGIEQSKTYLAPLNP